MGVFFFSFSFFFFGFLAFSDSMVALGQPFFWVGLRCGCFGRDLFSFRVGGERVGACLV
jgi:hypothetical protein